MFRIVQSPPFGQAAPCGHGRPAHEPRRPDVAEHSALVAQAVHEPGFAEQVVELGAVLLGDLAADGLDPRFTVVVLLDPAADRGANGAKQRVGQLEGVPTGDVEAVEQPVADQFEVLGERRTDFVGPGPELGEDLAGIAVGLQQRSGVVVGLEGGEEPVQLEGGPRRHRRGAAHERQQIGGRDLGPGHQVGHQVADRDHRRGRVRHVLVDHPGVMVPAPDEVVGQLFVGERVGVHRLDLPVHTDRGRLRLRVPLFQVSAPRPGRERLGGPPEPLGDLLLGSGQLRDVGVPVGVDHLEPVQEQPIAPAHLLGPRRERGGMGVHPVPGGGSREVDRVALPGTGPGRRELEIAGGCGGHRSSSPFSCRPHGLAGRASTFAQVRPPCPGGAGRERPLLVRRRGDRPPAPAGVRS